MYSIPYQCRRRYQGNANAEAVGNANADAKAVANANTEAVAVEPHQENVGSIVAGPTVPRPITIIRDREGMKSQ